MSAPSDGASMSSASTWRSAANCRAVPLSLFFGSDGETAAERLAREEHAKRLCWACPVRDACLVSAALAGDRGVRGGRTAEERAIVRRRWVRRGQVVWVPGGGYRRGESEWTHIECDHCLRTGAEGGPGPGGMRLTVACRERWTRAGRPATVPDSGDPELVKTAA